MIIPKHFPATKLAARDSPLEWVTVMTSPAPVAHFLAWENSVYKAFPFDWLVAGKTPILRRGGWSGYLLSGKCSISGVNGDKDGDNLLDNG